MLDLVVSVPDHCLSFYFTRENLSYIPTLPTRDFEQEFEMIVTTSADVLKKLSALKASKSASPNGLHGTFLLELKEILCEPLTCIFNKSLESGEVPTQYHLFLEKEIRNNPKIIVISA